MRPVVNQAGAAADEIKTGRQQEMNFWQHAGVPVRVAWISSEVTVEIESKSSELQLQPAKKQLKKNILSFIRL